MKAVVVELNKNQAAVLSDDGCVITVKNKNYEIGQIIQVSKPQMNIVKKVTVFAASVAACLFLGVGTWAYASPYTYVSVDVNPSIEFTVNRFDRVIKVKAVNDDGEDILQEISPKDLKNETITVAITRAVQQITDAGYFSSEAEGGIVIATSSEDTEKADELALELQETVEQKTTENGDNVVVEVFSVGLDRVEEARELGVTPGKLNLVEKLQEAADTAEDIDIEEWLDKPVKDIMKATKEYKNSKENTEDVSDEATIEDSEDKQPNADSEKNKDLEKAEKEAEKAKKDAVKAEEKAAEAQKKADKKAKEATDETNGEDQEDAKLEAEQAKKEAEEALKAAEKANDQADKAAEKAKKEAEKVKKEAEKADNKVKENANPQDKPSSDTDIGNEDTIDDNQDSEDNDNQGSDDNKAGDNDNSGGKENQGGNSGGKKN